jgi:hypothetical protein
MTKFSAELAVSICDFLCGCSVVKRACEAHNIGESTFWLWVKQSKADPPELPTFEWMSMEMSFAEGVQNARRLFANGLLDSALQRSRYGSSRRVIYQGQECFKLDRRIPPDITDPDILEMFYDQRDHYLRDDKGHLVYLTEAVDPPVALTLAVLASQFEIFQPHSSQTISVINKDEMGVLHVGGDKPKTVQLEHTPILPHAVVTEPSPERTGEALQGEDSPVAASIDRSPAYVPPTISSKTPQGPVKIFRAEAMADDPPEVIGGNDDDAATAVLADPPPAVKAATPDVMLHPSVRAALLKNHTGERANGAVEAQIMRALVLQMTPEQRVRRLRELTGSYFDSESRSEHLGVGPSGPKGVRMA